MNMMITNDCINCGACALECRNDAIEAPNKYLNKKEKKSNSFALEHYQIIEEFCDKCIGLKYYKCVEVCPMNSIITY